MITSFTFNGVSCESLGLTYAPEKKDMYVWGPVSRNIHEQQFEGHHGGYFFGASRKWKDFILKCYFEPYCGEEDFGTIMDGLFTRIEREYQVGRQGRLSFSNRPWIYYDAVIVNYDATNLTSKRGGVVVITMRAYYPYGLCDRLDLLPSSDEFYSDMKNNSSMIHNTVQYFPIEYSGESLLHNNSKKFYLFNPGTVTADVAVKIKGVIEEGLTMTNQTTGQRLRLSASTGTDDWYVCNSKNGNCYYEDGAGRKTANYIYHDYGFIQLAPADFAYTCTYQTISPNTVITIQDTDGRLAGRNFKGACFITSPENIGTVTESSYSGTTLTLTFSSGDITLPMSGGTGVLYSGHNVITANPDVEIEDYSFRFEYKPTFN